jgi:Domain of unknown function (DUF4406)
MKLIYIAGPMTGYKDMNFPAFNEKEIELIFDGWHTVNPVAINPDPATPWLECMKRDLRALLMCDAIYMLRGWKDSKGASLEHHIATELGLEILYEEE